MRTESENESAKWQVPDIGCIVVSTIWELKQKLPENESFTEIKIGRQDQFDPRTVVYSRTEKTTGRTTYVAYGCKSCDEIKIQKPLLYTANQGTFPEQKEPKVKAYCKSCGLQIYEEKVISNQSLLKA